MRLLGGFCYFSPLAFLRYEAIQIIVAMLQLTAGITLRNKAPSSITFVVLIIAFKRKISNITMKRVLEILLFCIVNSP